MQRLPMTIFQGAIAGTTLRLDALLFAARFGLANSVGPFPVPAGAECRVRRRFGRVCPVLRRPMDLPSLLRMAGDSIHMNYSSGSRLMAARRRALRAAGFRFISALPGFTTFRWTGSIGAVECP